MGLKIVIIVGGACMAFGALMALGVIGVGFYSPGSNTSGISGAVLFGSGLITTAVVLTKKTS